MKNLGDKGLIFNPQFLCLLLDTFQVIAIDSDIQDRVFFSLLDSRDDFFILAAADAFYGGVTASATLNQTQPGTTSNASKVLGSTRFHSGDVPKGTPPAGSQRPSVV